MPLKPTMNPARRQLMQLLGAGALLPTWPALSLAAPGPAEAPRLVVIMLRGALDGLAAVPVPGDPAFATLRGELAPTGALPLDGFYALHPSLPTLARWYAEGQLLVLHALASPYRERSHFDAQQQLESGGPRPFALSTGWLGRALQATGQGGVALSPALPVALRGADQASSWTPSRPGPADSEDLLTRVQQLYAGDAALHTAWQQAMAQRDLGRMAGEEPPGNGFAALAEQAGRFLAAERGPRLAWLESGGWDTHNQQSNRLARQLAGLDQGMAALRSALGPQWARSTVLVMTEFGRTARPNGSGGTDHGTGGVAWLAGGAVAGGRVLADWPGLGNRELLEARDLRPTLDIRALQAALLQRQFGLGRAALEGGVLPGAPRALDGLWRV